MPTASVICLRCSCPYELSRGRLSVVQQTVCPRCGYPGWADATRTQAPRSAT